MLLDIIKLIIIFLCGAIIGRFMKVQINRNQETVIISHPYPIMELLNGLIYILIFAIRGISVDYQLAFSYHFVSVLYCLVASALFLLSIIDLQTYEIPPKFNYFIFIIGLIRLGLDSRNWSLYIIGFFAISTFLYLLFRLSGGRAMGGGDIKLMAAAGLLLGWENIILAFFLGCVLGSAIHIIRMKISNANRVLAMGPYLSAGIFIAMLYGDKLWSWYLGAFYSI